MKNFKYYLKQQGTEWLVDQNESTLNYLDGGELQYCPTFYTYIGKIKINIIITEVSQIAKYIV
jgi:hypothetical protein